MAMAMAMVMVMRFSSSLFVFFLSDSFYPSAFGMPGVRFPVCVFFPFPISR